MLGTSTLTVTLVPSCLGMFTTMLGRKIISGGSGHCTTGAGHETPGGCVGGGYVGVGVGVGVGLGLGVGGVVGGGVYGESGGVYGVSVGV